MPVTFWLSRLCEEFSCLPGAAYRAWLEAPVGLLEEILEARAYASAKRIYEAATNKQEIPSSPIMDLVRTVSFDLAREAIEERKAETGG